MELNELKEQVRESVNEHSSSQTIDGLWYNSSVIAAILSSSFATFLIDDCPFVAKILTALSAIIIAIDRSLNWGARWVYHRQMRHEYLLILARINLVENLGDNYSEDEKKKYFLLIFDDLFTIRKRESLIPGIGDAKKQV